RSLLPLPLPSLRRAVLDPPFDSLSELASLLPPSTTYASLFDHFSNLCLTAPGLTLSSSAHKVPISKLIEEYKSDLSLHEIELFTLCPINIRDERALAIFKDLLEAFCSSGLVSIDAILSSSRLLKTLAIVEDTLHGLPPLPKILGIGRTPFVPPVLISSIPLLETLHKSLVLYIWLSFRLAINLPDRAIAVAYKERTERVLEQCLERLPGLRNRKSHERRQGKEKMVVKDEYGRKRIEWLGKEDEGEKGKKLAWISGDEARKEGMRTEWKRAGVVDL
ncbi:hypothetical protein P7C73_g4904, partial [Tremellales sp. Uapishka_1]